MAKCLLTVAWQCRRSSSKSVTRKEFINSMLVVITSSSPNFYSHYVSIRITIIVPFEFWLDWLSVTSRHSVRLGPQWGVSIHSTRNAAQILMSLFVVGCTTDAEKNGFVDLPEFPFCLEPRTVNSRYSELFRHRSPPNFSLNCRIFYFINPNQVVRKSFTKSRVTKSRYYDSLGYPQICSQGL